jgi:hypothetical protein
LRAKQELATDIGTRVDLGKELLMAEREERIAQVENDKEFTRAQKDAQIAALNRLYGTPAETDKDGNTIITAKPGLLAQQINLEEARQLEEEARQLADLQNNVQRDALQVQYDMADTQAERKRIALAMFDLEQRYQESLLEAVIASETATKAEKERAELALEGLRNVANTRRDAVARGNETDVERYLRELNQSPAQINESIDAIKMNGLDQLNASLVDAIMGVKSLGDAFRAVASQIIADLLRIAIQRAIIQPLANALFPGSGGGGVPGFASGTNFAPGGLALVGERGPELVNLPRGSQVIPNHDLTGMGQQVHKPTFVFPGVTDARMAREAAGQAARRYRLELNGPLR